MSLIVFVIYYECINLNNNVSFDVHSRQTCFTVKMSDLLASKTNSTLTAAVSLIMESCFYHERQHIKGILYCFSLKALYLHTVHNTYTVQE